MKHKKWYRCALVFCLGIFVTFAVVLPARAESDIGITINYGYEKTGKLGYGIPVFITLDKVGKYFNGYICIKMPYQKNTSSTGQIEMLSSLSQSENYMFQKEIHSGSKDSITENIEIPLIVENQEIQVQIKDEKEHIILTKQFSLDVQNSNSSIVLGTVFKDAAKELSINTILNDYMDVGVRTIPIAENSLPEEWFGLDLFDVIVFDRESYDGLTEKEKSLFKQWEQSGGTIRIIENEQEYNNIKSLNDEDALRALVGENAVSELAVKANNGSSSRYYNVIWMINSINAADFPVIWKYAALLLLYIILVGPLTYVFLKSKDKRNYTWMSVLVLSLAFSFVIYLMGNPTRFRKPFLKYVSFLHMNEMVTEDTYFTIQAPYNYNYYLNLKKDCSVTPLNEELYRSEDSKSEETRINTDYNIAVRKLADETEIEIKNLAAFTQEAFLASRCIRENADDLVTGNLNLFLDDAKGTITNNSEYDIDNALLVLRNRIIPIGTIKSKEQVSLDDKKSEIYTIGNIYNTLSDYLNLNTENDKIKRNIRSRKDSINYEKLNALNYCIQSYNGSLENKALLIGFSPQYDNVDIQANSGCEVYGITCIMADITDVDYTKGGYRYQPYVREHAEAKEGYYDSYSDSVYGEDTIISYKLGDFTSDAMLHFDEQDVDAGNDTTKVFDGEIYLFNNEKQEYDLLDYHDKSVSFPLSKEYILPDNTISVKYKVDLTDKIPNAKLPFISLTGGYQDAAN